MIELDTALVIEGVHIPLRSAVEYTEDWQPIGDFEDHQTWDGETHIVAPTYKPKYRIVLQASGRGVFRLPDLDDVLPGTELVLHSKVERTRSIAIGASQCILLRDPVPGSIRVWSENDPEGVIPHTLDGKTVSIAAAATERLVVSHRWMTTCLTRRPMGANVNGRTSEHGWDYEFIEKSAPA